MAEKVKYNLVHIGRFNLKEAKQFLDDYAKAKQEGKVFIGKKVIVFVVEKNIKKKGGNLI